MLWCLFFEYKNNYSDFSIFWDFSCYRDRLKLYNINLKENEEKKCYIIDYVIAPWTLKIDLFINISISGTQLLEIYTLEIQMYTEQKNNKQLKELYERSLKVRSAIPHPLIMSVIRECGGKMHLRSGDYEKVGPIHFFWIEVIYLFLGVHWFFWSI